ncbi:hypothetical protein KI387_024319, partial [Taxus chinensis]
MRRAREADSAEGRRKSTNCFRTCGTKEREPAESGESEEFVPDSTGTFGTNGCEGCEPA